MMLCTEDTDIIKEGFLQKKSSFFGIYKERWCVVTGSYLTSYKTFQDARAEQNATEIFDLNIYDNAQIVENKDNIPKFRLYSSNSKNKKKNYRSFKVKSVKELNEWIRAINYGEKTNKKQSSSSSYSLSISESFTTKYTQNRLFPNDIISNDNDKDQKKTNKEQSPKPKVL